MTTPPTSGGTFQSIRIIGRKAQNLLHRARQLRDQMPSARKKVRPPSKHCEEVIMHVSTVSVAKATFTILGILAAAWLILHLRDKILLLLLGLFVSVVMDPGVTLLERWRIPRAVAILIHYLVALVLMLFLFLSLIPIIATQVQQIALFLSAEVNLFLANPNISLPLLSDETNLRLTQLLENTLRDLSIYQFTDALQRFGQNLAITAQGSLRFAAQLAGSVLNFLVNLIIVLVLGFFLQMEKERIVQWVRSLVPARYVSYVDAKADAIHGKIGQWARGELLLMCSIFLLTLLALVILRMPYALTLAVLAGFCEFIPAIGPLIASIPAVIIGLSHHGFVFALVVAGTYYVIQWCENNLLVPLIMKRAVGLSPVAILFAMMVGVSFANTIHPVLGVMLAIPTTTILAIFLRDWTRS